MTDKKEWYRSIPAHGVLCKVAGDDAQFVHIQDKHDLAEFCCDYAVDESVLNPVTPAEWWQFAPWQDMKDVPKNVEILGVCDNELHIVKYATGHWVLSSWIEGDCFLTRNNRKKDITKWLPLPEESQ